MVPQRVVVTGLGVASCLGCAVDEFWRRLIGGESGVAALKDDAFASLTSRTGAVVQGYDREHFDRKEVRRLSRSSQLAVVAASQAVRQAGLSENGVERRDVAVLIGSSIGGYSASDNFFRDYYLHGWRGPLVIPTSMNTAPSSNVSIRFGLGGLLINVDGACAAAAHSIGGAAVHQRARDGHPVERQERDGRDQAGLRRERIGRSSSGTRRRWAIRWPPEERSS